MIAPPVGGEGVPHEDGKTVPMGTVSGEEAPLENEVGSHRRVGALSPFRTSEPFLPRCIAALIHEEGR